MSPTNYTSGELRREIWQSTTHVNDELYGHMLVILQTSSEIHTFAAMYLLYLATSGFSNWLV